MRIRLLPPWKVKRQSKVNWRNKETEFTKLSWRKKRRSVFLDPTYEWEHTMFIFLWRISLSMIPPKVHPFLCVCVWNMVACPCYSIIYIYICTQMRRNVRGDVSYTCIIKMFYTKMLHFVTWTKPWKTMDFSFIDNLHQHITHQKCYFFYILYIYIIGGQ